MDGKGTKESDEIKPLNLKILEATSKNVAITKKKGKQSNISGKLYIPTRCISLRKLALLFTFSDKSLIQ